MTKSNRCQSESSPCSEQPPGAESHCGTRVACQGCKRSIGSHPLREESAEPAQSPRKRENKNQEPRSLGCVLMRHSGQWAGGEEGPCPSLLASQAPWVPQNLGYMHRPVWNSLSSPQPLDPGALSWASCPSPSHVLLPPFRGKSKWSATALLWVSTLSCAQGPLPGKSAQTRGSPPSSPHSPGLQQAH